MSNTLLRLPAVKAECGYSRSTLYLRISQGLWPRPVRLGARSVAWPAGEVASINAARIAGKSEAEIRALVARLEAGRSTALLLLVGMDGSQCGEQYTTNIAGDVHAQA